MKVKGNYRVKLIVIFTCSFALIMGKADVAHGQIEVEKLTRGLVAVKSGSGYFLSWRLFGTDQGTDIAFNIYKGTTKLNSTPITDATCYQDNGNSTGDYSVRAIVGGEEQAASSAEYTLSNNYISIPLQNASGYRAGDASCGDLDGDGQYEIVLKEENSPQDNSNSGRTGQTKLTAYKLDGTRMWRIDLGINIREGAHYTQFMVYDLDGDGSAEIACKTAPGSKDAGGSYLKLGPAANADHAADYRNSDGYILSGPEYFTIFSGRTGKELATVDYKPPRGTVSSWGDSYGNRVDRFLACVAYLDGHRPSVVMCRGYYTRTCLWALDWRNEKLTERWFFDSNAGGNSAGAGQGNHNLSVGDVDDDGKQEIVYGACTIDDDGTLLGSSRVGHGDAAHLTDIDPERPGLEYWCCHEGGACADLRDPSQSNGGVLWSKKGTDDVGRACAADITASHPGMECWASTGVGAYNCKGTSISGPSQINFLLWWDGDLLRELLDGTTVSKFGGGSLLSASGCSAINGTKSNPCLSADLFGDWREEVMFSCGGTLRIYTTTTPTNHRFYTLMHDPHYRVSIAWQNVAYNQPPHTGFFLGDGMTLPQKKPDIVYPDGSGTSLRSIAEIQPVQMSGAPIKVYGDRMFVLPGKAPTAPRQLSVYDLSGKHLRDIITRKKAVSLNECKIARGVYIVRISDKTRAARR
ncbi:MAG: rhamnogalacturonan lyase [Chitinispirillaceae bacterium]|nr:rhamnogalacturonan lyase [Chitinispirillaceae bacterium]